MKGFGTALLVDLLAGSLSGSAHGPAPEPGAPTVGATVLAIDPSRLGLDLDDLDAANAVTRSLVEAAGGRWPGQRSRESRARAERSGTVRVASGIVQACRTAIGGHLDRAVRR